MKPYCFLITIDELALLCASRYVDHCEFAAADELLVKPGSFLLQVQGGKAAVSRGRGGRALHRFMHFGNVDDKYVGKYLRT